MAEPKRDDASEQQPDSTKADDMDSAADTKLDEERQALLRQRKRISREEIFDEYSHIPGYSDMQGFSNLSFVFTVEEEVEDDEAEDDESTTDQSTKAADTKENLTADKTVDKSD